RSTSSELLALHRLEFARRDSRHFLPERGGRCPDGRRVELSRLGRRGAHRGLGTRLVRGRESNQRRNLVVFVLPLPNHCPTHDWTKLSGRRTERHHQSGPPEGEVLTDVVIAASCLL